MFSQDKNIQLTFGKKETLLYLKHS